MLYKTGIRDPLALVFFFRKNTIGHYLWHSQITPCELDICLSAHMGTRLSKLCLFTLTIFFWNNSLLSSLTVCLYLWAPSSTESSDVILLPVLGKHCPAAVLGAGRSVSDMHLLSIVDDGHEMQPNRIPPAHNVSTFISFSKVRAMSTFVSFVG